LVLINTVMLERVLYEGDYLYRMDEIDFNAMTPLSYLKDKGIVDAKVQLLSGLKHRGNLGFYKEISLSDVEHEYRDAMG